MIQISIVIPIYNVAQYLRACLDSIYAQSIDESSFEIICVNDCSPDNSREIVLEYQKIHKNIHLINHSKNKKAGGARNSGIEIAKGKWIWFIDADDTIEPNGLKKVLYHCSNDDLDALCFNYQFLYRDRTVVKHIFNSSTTVQCGVDFLLTTFGEGLIYHLGYPWRTVYRRSLIIERSIRFPEQLLYGEDTTFMVETIMYANKVMAIRDVLYNYRQNVITSSSTQLVEMRGERIYDSIFNAGTLILELKEKTLGISPKLASKIEIGIPWFVNRLFMRLVKTNVNELYKFYNLLKNNPHIPLKNYMNLQNRLVVEYPKIGLLLLRIVAVLYKIKHR